MTDEMKSLCDELRRAIPMITLEWIDRVKADPYLKSDDPLTLTQIIDHIPEMLEELCMLLHEKKSDFETVRASSSHGYTRALEGYSLTELLRELELLRDTVFNHVAEIEKRREGSRNETIQALRIVNEYFGEDILFVVEHYLRHNQAPPAAK